MCRDLDTVDKDRNESSWKYLILKYFIKKEENVAVQLVSNYLYFI